MRYSISAIRATVRRADRIFMFEHGRVVETGTFNELMRAGGPFAELAKAQYLSAEPPTLPGEALSNKIRAAE